MPLNIEYAEEDEGDSLFGSPEPEDPWGHAADNSTLSQSQSARPITNSSAASTALHNPPTPSSNNSVSSATVGTAGGRSNRLIVSNRITQRFEERQNELRKQRASSKSQPTRTKGVASLRSISISILKEYAPLVKDIGHLDYHIVAEVIDDLPVDQLLELETNCPHIRKDTDWLWESFLLSEFPLFHERCKEKHGQPRTSGWRRMYKKAKEEAIEKQQQAVDRVAQRYRQLDEERKAKRIVVLDKVVSSKHARVGSSRSSFPGSRYGYVSNSTSGGGGSSNFPRSSTSSSSASSAIAKARTEAQRARIALTHASGRYIPPNPTHGSRPIFSQSEAEREIFRNPYLPSPSSSSSLSRQVRQIRPPPSSLFVSTSASPGYSLSPPPRTYPHVKSTDSRRSNDKNTPTLSPPSNRFEGSFRSNPSERADLPSHLTRPKSSLATVQSPTSITTPHERFKIDPSKSKSTSKMQIIHKPKIENFEAPKPQPQTFNYFASSISTSATSTKTSTSTLDLNASKPGGKVIGKQIQVKKLEPSLRWDEKSINDDNRRNFSVEKEDDKIFARNENEKRLGMKRSRTNYDTDNENNGNNKDKDEDEDEGESEVKIDHQQTPSSSTRSGSTMESSSNCSILPSSNSTSRAKFKLPIASQDREHIESVLFRKKKPVGSSVASLRKVP